jgi:hypothetical protein
LKAVNVIKVALVVVQLVSVAAFGLSLYIITSVLNASLSGSGMSAEMTFDEATGSGLLEISLASENGGLLAVDLSVELGVVGSDGDYIVRDAIDVHLEPGDISPRKLSLVIPTSDVQRMMEEGRGSDLEIVLDLRTLYDLVGISNTLTIEGGAMR